MLFLKMMGSLQSEATTASIGRRALDRWLTAFLTKDDLRFIYRGINHNYFNVLVKNFDSEEFLRSLLHHTKKLPNGALKQTTPIERPGY